MKKLWSLVVQLSLLILIVLFLPQQVDAQAIPTPNKVVELTEKRTEYSRTFRNTDLTETLQLYPVPIFYQNEANEWKLIDNEITNVVSNPEEAVHFHYQNRANSFQTYYKLQNTETVFKVKEENLSFGYSLEQSNPATGIVLNQTITYPEVYPNVNVQIENTSYGSIHTFEILSNGANAEFLLPITTNGSLSISNGTIEIADSLNSRNRWSIGELELVDVNGKRSNRLHIGLTEQQGVMKAEIELDTVFLQEESTVFPVYAQFTVASIDRFNKVNDAYVHEEWQNENFSSQTSLSAGTKASFTTRAFIRFGTELPVIPGLMNHAVFYLYEFGKPATSGYYDPVIIDRTMSLHGIKEDWSPKSVTWNTQPAITQMYASDTYYKKTTNGMHAWNVSDLIGDWYTSNEYYGILMKSVEESVEAQKTFYSSRYGNPVYSPRLEINYAPSNFTVSGRAIGEGVNSERNRLEVSWSGVAGASGYKLLIFNGKDYEELDVGTSLSWNSAGSTIWPTKYQIANGEYELKRDGTGVQFSDDPLPVYQNAGGQMNELKYLWKVKAYNQYGEIFSNPVTIIPYDQTAPTKPGTPIVENSLYSNLTLSWQPSTDRNFKGYYVKGTSQTAFDFRTSFTTANRITLPYSLTPKADYQVTIQAVDEFGNFINSEVATIRARHQHDASYNSYSVNNEMYENSEYETVRISFRNEGATAWDSTYYVKEVTNNNNFVMVPIDVIGRNEVVLPGGTKTFTYKIKVGNRLGRHTLQWRMAHESFGEFGSSLSRLVDVKPVQTVVSPAVWPSGSRLSVSEVSQTSVKLTWTAANDAESYKIYQANQLIKTVSKDARSFVVNGLLPNANYTFQVQAENRNALLTTNGPKVSMITLGKSSTRIAGANRYATAVSISQKGWERSRIIIIARGDDFPDALAGAPLAYKLDAPILLTNKQTLSKETANEIKRLGASQAIILGGVGAVSEDVANSLKGLGLSIERIAGKNRFDTAAKIAQRLGGNPSTAIITNGFTFPDALAIGSYAARNGFPILLASAKTLPAETKSAISKVQSTILIGGTQVLSDGVERQLPSPRRINGKNRFDTAAQIVKTFNFSTEKAFVATGMGFADGLTGSVLAAKHQAPLLLVHPSKLPTETNAMVEQKGYIDFAILGGTGAVGEDVFSQLTK